MISVSSNQKIFDHGITVEKPVLESSDITAGAYTLVAGGPVRIANGLIVPCTSDVKVFGLSKVNKNIYVDETGVNGGGLGGIYGSGKATVVIKGIVTVRQSYFQSTTGAAVTVNAFDDTVTFTPMQKLFCDTAGLITNLPPLSLNSYIGYCLVPPTTTVKAMQIMLDC